MQLLTLPPEMNNALSPQESYQKQLALFTQQLARLERNRSRIGIARLAVFVLTIFAAYKIFSLFGLFGLVPTIVCIGILLYLVSLDFANSEKLRNTKTLIQLNEEEISALAHQFTQREDGHQFLPTDHAYAADMDLFGPSSIYQWLSRCYTEGGRKRLAENLLQALLPQAVLERQEAVKELTQKLDWRQQWQAFAMRNPITLVTEKKIYRWLDEEEKIFIHPGWKTATIVYSTVALGTAVATLLGYLPAALFSTLFLLYLIVSLILSRQTIKPSLQLDGIVKEAGTLQALVDWLEGTSFTTPHLKTLQNSLRLNTTPAGKELKALKVILDRFDLRASIIGFLALNPFLLWDVRQIIALNNWRQRNKLLVKKWFSAVAEMEVIHSLSTVHFNHPQWCFPHFSSQHFTLRGEAIGHPLLPEAQRVVNDFSLQGTAKVDLITGSNMAGKSTFLRSLGVNIVLAQMGSPVCATAFLVSPVQLASSMRIADNLAENTSTFYAELKKLRTIIERVKSHEKLFILLDEILRGTNSFDRHKGAAALIRQLIKEDAVAVIATHDVELAAIERDFPQAITNYHFDVTIEGEELYFDYKLKTGVCQSLNASLLMKKIGIDLE